MALLARRVRGQTVRGLVIGLIYPHSPECHLHQLTSIITAGLPRCLRSRKCVYSVCLCLCGWLDGPIIILTSRHFPPVTHLNEAPKTVEAVYVCRYLIHCCFMVFFSRALPLTSSPSRLQFN